ncbi:MAG TPA: VWA domain-containing protein [Terriglobales bacterium]|nr:VWA domain-containing protein [Terriglobales bacterium]
MTSLPRILALNVIVLWLFGLCGAFAQQQSNQQIPDAPSAVKPPSQLPSAPEPQAPPPSNGSREEPTSPPAIPPNSPPPSSSTVPQAPGEDQTEPPPPAKISTVPAGSVPKDQSGSQEPLYKIVTNVNQVIVPVRVTDESGLMVSGLLYKDFSVYEDGKKQTLNFFTSDPFALSTAVVLDLGMPDAELQKVNQTFPALVAAFSQFDEVALYVYGESVTRMTDFAAVGRQLEARLNELKATARGENNGVPVTSGPMGPNGPAINGVPMGQPATPVVTPSKRAHVLNDALLKAALDLAKQDKARRKIIFMITDGREYRSDAKYSSVLQVLLSNNIIVYGVDVGSSAIPGYRSLEKLHIPGQGYSDIMPKYVNATAGEMLAENSRKDIEGVYQRLIGDARNQYTLGYVARATPIYTRREIEVRVSRPDCQTSDVRPCVKVYAKPWYYPLPARP